jgi:hypothetical protein
MGSYAFCFYVEVRLVRLDQYSERNVTNFEPGHNLDRNSFLKVKKEVPQDGQEKHCRQCDGRWARQALSVATRPAQICNEVCSASV